MSTTSVINLSLFNTGRKDQTTSEKEEAEEQRELEESLSYFKCPGGLSTEMAVPRFVEVLHFSSPTSIKNPEFLTPYSNRKFKCMIYTPQLMNSLRRLGASSTIT